METFLKVLLKMIRKSVREHIPLPRVTSTSEDSKKEEGRVSEKCILTMEITTKETGKME